MVHRKNRKQFVVSPLIYHCSWKEQIFLKPFHTSKFRRNILQIRDFALENADPWAKEEQEDRSWYTNLVKTKSRSLNWSGTRLRRTNFQFWSWMNLPKQWWRAHLQYTRETNSLKFIKWRWEKKFVLGDRCYLPGVPVKVLYLNINLTFENP